MRSTARTLQVLLLAGSLFTAAQASVAPAYQVTDLGSFFPTGVNNSGWVSGYNGRALLWRPGLGLLDLGSFGEPVGAVSNRANAVNDAGQVVGFTWSVADSAYRAFLWQDGAGLSDLGDLPGGGNTSRADAINEAGMAAGRGAGQFSSHPTYGNLSYNHATRFDAPGIVLHLENHAEATLNSIARGINNTGITVGERQTPSGWRAILWDEGGSPLDLGVLWAATGGGAASDSFARDVNNLGQVALQLPLAGGGFGAAVWQAGAGFTLIGQLDGYSAAAHAINDAGVVVGTAGAAGAAGTQAFAWSAEAGLLSLTSLVNPATSGGWLIGEASAVSENGLIVGRGWHPSLGYRGVLLTPVPELPSLLLAAVGALVLLGWTRQRRPT
jgi:probable HAF family extracellular repeat protein